MGMAKPSSVVRHLVFLIADYSEFTLNTEVFAQFSRVRAKSMHCVEVLIAQISW